MSAEDYTKRMIKPKPRAVSRLEGKLSRSCLFSVFEGCSCEAEPELFGSIDKDSNQPASPIVLPSH